ncbi:MAG: glutamate-1-semialdehyde 2,1-aminomutase [Hyphomicrobiaceae bacterium]|jgi:glutamate-1-semialdehyde 2,1-aminomutase
MRRNIPLDEALAEARETYVHKHPKARAVHEEACRHLPGGNTRTVLFHGPFPLRAERGEGPYLHDVDGHRYLNLLGEYTAGIFGHSHPVIQTAIVEAAATGMNLGAHNVAEAELARLVTQRFPTLERVRFTNSGTEANLMAVATARHVTGRGKVLVFKGGYHGGLLYFGGGGMPLNAPYEFVVGIYNDVEKTRELIREHAADLACVLVEPMMGSGGCIPAEPEFLAVLREESSHAGAKLIFDEVMTSRFGRHGAGHGHGIKADLMTLGKWVGGGMSFGAFGGEKTVMDIFDPTQANVIPHAGTFNNNVFSMKAGIAALSTVFTSDEAERLDGVGNQFRQRLNQILEQHGVGMSFSGRGSLMNLHGVVGSIRSVADVQGSDDQAKELVFFDLLDRGFYMARRGFMALSIVLEAQHLDDFCNAFEDVIVKRRTALPQR